MGLFSTCWRAYTEQVASCVERLSSTPLSHGHTNSLRIHVDFVLEITRLASGAHRTQAHEENREQRWTHEWPRAANVRRPCVRGSANGRAFCARAFRKRRENSSSPSHAVMTHVHHESHRKFTRSEHAPCRPQQVLENRT